MGKELSLSGTGVAMVTPFYSDKSIDFDALGKLIDSLVKGGVEFLVSLGSTAEAATLNKDEQDAVLDFTIEYLDGRLPLVAGFAGNDTQALCQRIGQRNMKGVDAILSASPHYNKPSQEGIFQHFLSLASATDLPIILYNVPGRTGSNMTAETCLRLAKHSSQFVAMKEASGDMEQCMKIAQSKPKGFFLLSGEDALTLPLCSAGFDGVISVIANGTPERFSRMVRHCLAGDYKTARKDHYAILDLIDAIFQEGNPTGIKSLLSHKRIIKNHLRAPLLPASAKLHKRIGSLLKRLK